MNKLPDESEIQSLLLRLGARPNYVGFHYAEYGIRLALEDENRLQAVTKELYLEIARHYPVSWSTVEYNLRTMINKIWNKNRTHLKIELRYPFPRKPTVGEFLAVVTLYLRIQGKRDSGK